MLVGLVLMALCAPGIVTAQSRSGPPGDPVAGARLFRARGCIDCHANDVADFQRQARPLDALAAAMWNHFPLMADRIRASRMTTPYFTSGEMRDVAAFLSSGTPDRGPADPSLLGRAGDPGRGEQLVAEKGCLECHSISSPHGKRAGNLADLKGLESPWAVVAQMWNHAFLMELDRQGQRVSWPRFTAGEMADLVAFLQALMRAR
jgi:cytochrome c551/c552